MPASGGSGSQTPTLDQVAASSGKATITFVFLDGLEVSADSFQMSLGRPGDDRDPGNVEYEAESTDSAAMPKIADAYLQGKVGDIEVRFGGSTYKCRNSSLSTFKTKGGEDASYTFAWTCETLNVEQ